VAVGVARFVTADPRVAAAWGFAAVVGHVFPIFHGFRGGKGVATALGAFLVLATVPALVCLGVFVAIVAGTRYVSLASVLALTLLPAAAGLLRAPRPVVLAAGGTALIVIGKHVENLKRLAKGEERRLGR